MSFIRYLFQVSRLDEKPKVEEQKKAGPSVNNLTIMRCSNAVGILLILSAITQLIITLIIPVSNEANIFVVYARNISSIACLAALGLFMMSWCGWIVVQINKDVEDKDDDDDNEGNDGFFRSIIIFACILSAIKGLYSAGLVVYLMNGLYIKIAYYLGETIGWFAIALLLWQIYRRLFSSKSSLLDRNNYRKFIIALIAIFMFKAIVSLFYTMLAFDPRFLPWIFYLADTLAWFLLAFFFSLYINSGIAISGRKTSITGAITGTVL